MLQVKWKVIIAVVGVVVMGLSAYFVPVTYRVIRERREELLHHSDMMFLNAVIREAMANRYKVSGNYPQTLGELKDEILVNCYTDKSKMPEQSKFEGMLADFVYFSDNASYEIMWEVKDRGKNYKRKEVNQDGKLLFTEIYIDEQLYSRKEYKDTR